MKPWHLVFVAKDGRRLEAQFLAPDRLDVFDIGQYLLADRSFHDAVVEKFDEVEAKWAEQSRRDNEEEQERLRKHPDGAP
jgi:hypothetical protein